MAKSYLTNIHTRKIIEKRDFPLIVHVKICTIKKRVLIKMLRCSIGENFKSVVFENSEILENVVLTFLPRWLSHFPQKKKNNNNKTKQHKNRETRYQNPNLFSIFKLSSGKYIPCKSFSDSAPNFWAVVTFFHSVF